MRVDTIRLHARVQDSDRGPSTALILPDHCLADELEGPADEITYRLIEELVPYYFWAKGDVGAACSELVALALVHYTKHRNANEGKGLQELEASPIQSQ